MFPLDNYCIECRKGFATETTFKRHMVQYKGHISQEPKLFERKKPGPVKHTKREDQLRNMRRNSKKHRSKCAIKKTIKTRNQATKREMRKMLKLTPDERREAYLQLLTEIDSACDDLEIDDNIIDCEEKHGNCWRHIVYDKCLFAGKSMFNVLYSQFFGNAVVEFGVEKFGKLSQSAQREVEQAVSLALKAQRPLLTAIYGPKLRAFRLIGNPLLLRFAPEMEFDDGYDTDACGLRQMERDDFHWKDLLNMQPDPEL